MKKISSLLLLVSLLFLFSSPVFAARPKKLSDFTGRPPIHIAKSLLTIPSGLTPQQIKTAYNLPTTGGQGTIAIIDAYDYPSAENDLNTFSQQFGLPPCTSANGCFEKHKMSLSIPTNTGWEVEEALDIEWAHAIAPKAKILLVEARNANGTSLLNAVTYSANRSDVTAVSMSWGGSEFDTEASYDSYFTSSHGVSFFASSGDSGSGVEWPAVSPNVIGVGGTHLVLTNTNTIATESAWNGSGGGISLIEPMPVYQTSFGGISSNDFRAVPDVSYIADPATGVSMYTTAGRSSLHGWLVVGGTSVGAPQWAAMKALSTTGFSNTTLYQDVVNRPLYFNDIVTGSNGSCGYVCTARIGYDFITGLGSPLTTLY